MRRSQCDTEAISLGALWKPRNEIRRPRSLIQKHTILFLAANPSEVGARALDQEAHAIWRELRSAGGRERFDFVTRWAVMPLDLLRELRVFQGSDGRGQRVSAQAIAGAFGAAGSSVQLVVLNGCYDDVLADALLAHVDCVVGTSEDLHDDATRSFAIGFYGGLSDHMPVTMACRQGQAAIHLESLQGSPQLRVRAGVDASQLVLAADLPTIGSVESSAAASPGA